MTICNPLQLVKYLKPNHRLLGLDLGERTIGLAMSDISLTIATPLTTITRRTMIGDVVTLAQIMHTHSIGGVVVGLPLQMDGTEGTQAIATRAFVGICVQHINTTVTFWDERLSSSASEKILTSGTNKQLRYRRKIIDKIAAAFLLQGFLNLLIFTTHNK